MATIPQASLPPVSAQCQTTLSFTQPGAGAREFASKMFRSADGKLRIDYGERTIISDQAAQQALIIDHLKREVRKLPFPPQLPGQPQFGLGSLQLPGLEAQSNKVEELGKRFIDGHEAEGKRYIVQLASAAKLPGAPAVPALPKVPNLPNLPGSPGPGEARRVIEVWTSTKLNLPLLTTITGSFGQQTNRCQIVAATEPPASHFQIPPGYKVVEMPKPPKTPDAAGIINKR